MLTLGCDALYTQATQFHGTKVMSKTKAIRLSDGEEKLIEEFLRINPIFEFSSLARTAILSFIQDPKMRITAVKKKMTSQRRGEANV